MKSEIVEAFGSLVKEKSIEKEVLTKRVEVNHPLRYRGYRFYQSSFDDRHVDSEGRWTTIIEVRKDKGSTLVWSGIIIVTLGLILGLYFSPREIFARIEKRDDKVQIQLACKTTRNPTLLTRHFKEIVNEIKIYSKDR